MRYTPKIAGTRGFPHHARPEKPDALYPENHGDERIRGRCRCVARDALYPENRGDERPESEHRRISV